MTSSSQSAILDALYHNRKEEAARLADGAANLTVFEAAALGRDDELRLLLQRNRDLANATAADGFTPLGLAAFFAGPSTIQLLLDHGADILAAARNEMRVQPIHAAVAGRQADSVRLLLDSGADPNSRQQVGYTPLMGAAGAGREDLVELLLARGADPGLVSDDGKRAADLAREHGHDALADRLSRLAF